MSSFVLQLDENVPLDNVEKSLHFFQEIYPKHLGNEKIDHAKLLNNQLKVNFSIFFFLWVLLFLTYYL